jgi:pimeloyl-ACP methyl ester carboxylesterase
VAVFLAIFLAAAEPSIAGLVVLAGGTQPLWWAAVRQVRYLASLDPRTAAASEPAIEALAVQARRADSPDLSPSTPAGELPFGLPAPYVLDLRAYDPVAVAASLGKPMLILQGGRDYQATVADDLARWQAGLAGRPDVTIRVYPAANHLFFPGSGPSSPAEYTPAQHMEFVHVVPNPRRFGVRDSKCHEHFANVFGPTAAPRRDAPEPDHPSACQGGRP